MVNMQEFYPFNWPLIPNPNELEVKKFFCLFQIWNTTIVH